MFKNQLLLLLILTAGVLTPVCAGQIHNNVTAAAAATTVAATTASEAGEKETLKRLEREWGDAVGAGDRAALDRLFDKNFARPLSDSAYVLKMDSR